MAISFAVAEIAIVVVLAKPTRLPRRANALLAMTALWDALLAMTELISTSYRLVLLLEVIADHPQ